MELRFGQDHECKTFTRVHTPKKQYIRNKNKNVIEEELELLEQDGDVELFHYSDDSQSMSKAS
jgi:hypothetical protein